MGRFEGCVQCIEQSTAKGRGETERERDRQTERDRERQTDRESVCV